MSASVVVDFSTVNAEKPARAVELTTTALRTAAKAAYDVFTAAGKVDTTFSKWTHSARQSVNMVRSELGQFASELAGVKMPSFNGGIGGFVAESAAMGIDIARQQEMRKRGQQEATRIAALGVAERRREVILNLPDDEFVNAGNVDATMAGISSRTKTDINKVQGAMVPTLSATGALSNDFAAKALERAFTRMPGNEQFAVDYSGRLLDLMNIEQAAGRSTDDAKFDQIEGALMSTQAASRVKSASKMAQTAVPLAKAMSQTGDSTERSFEYFAAMSNALADEMGDKTRTTMAGLSSHLTKTQRELPDLMAKGRLAGVPQADIDAFRAGKNTDERLAALHKSPKLFAALDKADQFNFGEADSKEVIRAVLQGDKKFFGQLDAAAGKVKWGDEASSFLSKKMTDLDAGTHQGILTADQGSAANIEADKLRGLLSQRSKQMRDVVTNTRAQMGSQGLGVWDAVDSMYQSALNWRQWDDSKPEISAERSLMQERVSAERHRRAADTPAEREKADNDIKLLNDQLALVRQALERNTAATAGNTAANGGTEKPPAPPPSVSLAQ